MKLKFCVLVALVVFSAACRTFCSSADVVTRAGSYKDSVDVRLLAVRDNYAYVADSFKGLEIVDVSDSARPTKVGQYKNRRPSAIMSMVVSGTHVYLGYSSGAIVILDISQPNNPVENPAFLTREGVECMDVSGSYLYVPRPLGLLILDISKTDDINVVSDTKLPLTPLAISVSGNRAYITDAEKGMFVVDISDPSTPKMIALAQSDSIIHNITARGTTVFALSGENCLQVFDTSAPTPIILGSLTGIGNTLSLYLSGSRAFVVGRNGGVRIIDVSDPRHPRQIATTRYGQARSIVAAGRYVYTANMETGLEIYALASAE